MIYFEKTLKNIAEKVCTIENYPYLCTAFETRDFRAFSSAGSEHLPYKQRVGGSNPSTPTKTGFTSIDAKPVFLCMVFSVKTDINQFSGMENLSDGERHC